MNNLKVEKNNLNVNFLCSVLAMNRSQVLVNARSPVDNVFIFFYNSKFLKNNFVIMCKILCALDLCLVSRFIFICFKAYIRNHIIFSCAMKHGNVQ